MTSEGNVDQGLFRSEKRFWQKWLFAKHVSAPGAHLGRNYRYAGKCAAPQMLDAYICVQATDIARFDLLLGLNLTSLDHNQRGYFWTL